MTDESRITTVLAGNHGEGRGRTRLTFTYLAHLAKVPEEHIESLLESPTMQSALQRHGWCITDSRRLRLPALLNGVPVPMLARITDD
jgi:hypothetical protein